jgi:DNA invertase Pin-like site-specific DNA recombinase
MYRPVKRIEIAGAGFRSLTESIDTTTPAGWMMMQMLGSFAEYERAMVKERTAAGLAAARAESRIGGRRPELTPAQRADIAENVLSGRRTAAQMARLYAVSQPTVSRILAIHRVSEGVWEVHLGADRVGWRRQPGGGRRWQRRAMHRTRATRSGR